LRLQQQFQEVEGTTNLLGDEVTISQVTLTGDQLQFAVTQGDQLRLNFEGRVQGDVMRGRVQVQGGSASGAHDWSAQRVSTSAPGHDGAGTIGTT
jgi:hypothetical protein